jgi:zinc transporter ZupT
VLGDKALRTLMLLGYLIALYSIPDGIAAPYAARLSGGPVAAGLVIASGQVGAVLVAPVFTKKTGAAAQVMPPATVIALGGGLGTLTACGLALRWRHILSS